MWNTRPQCYEIPGVYVAMAIKRAIERKGPVGPRSVTAPTSTTRPIEIVGAGTIDGARRIAAPTPGKRLLARIRLLERPRKIA